MSRILSGCLAMLLAALGLFVRSEGAHDAFHRRTASVRPVADGHGHVHHGSGRHSHSGEGVPIPGRHEHTSPVIDLLGEELLDLAVPAVVVAAFAPLREAVSRLTLVRIAKSSWSFQPPGRAPPFVVIY
ncbi:MAG: hypothetical protein ISQ14_14150 [Verrucomicrobiae bacterium]|nr:hypothetical protein [Verrucomicrobiae bacterium]